MDSGVREDEPGTGTLDHARAPAALIRDDEAGSVAREMATAFREYVDFYRRRMEKTPQEAIEAASDPASDEYRDVILRSQPDQVSWLSINALAQNDPALAQRTWERIKQEARDELASGHRAAWPLEEHDHSPWERARFLAVRESLAREWQPRNGIERMLLDMLAQAYAGYEYWMRLLVTYTKIEASGQDLRIERGGKWEPTRIGTAETMDQAAAMTDRFHRMLIRVQRALRDQRRYGLNVGNVGQLNIGLMQQNVAAGDERDRDESAVIEGTATATERGNASVADADTDTEAAAIPRSVPRTRARQRDGGGAHGGVYGESRHGGANRLEDAAVTADRRGDRGGP